MAKQTRKDKAQTYFLVTIVTLLIWLYAEGENIERFTEVPITIQFVTANKQIVIDKPEPQPVAITFLASRSVNVAIRELSQDEQIRIEVAEDPQRPDKTIVVQEVLDRFAPFAELGVSIERAEPATIDLRVERLVTRQLPVTLVSGALQLQGPPQITPPTASITLPSSIAPSIENQKLKARLIDLENFDRLEVNLPYDEQINLALPDVLLGQPNVRIEPQTVRVAFTIQKLTTDFTLPRVRILLELPFAQLDEFTVKLAENQEQFVRDLKLIGPNDLIEKIKKNEIEITAVLKLRPEDLEPGKQSKLLHINKPEQVQVVSELPRVDFVVTKRSTN